MRFAPGSWQALLQGLATVLDSLAALEAVARDLAAADALEIAQQAAAALIATPSEPLLPATRSAAPGVTSPALPALHDATHSQALAHDPNHHDVASATEDEMHHLSGPSTPAGMHLPHSGDSHPSAHLPSALSTNGHHPTDPSQPHQPHQPQPDGATALTTGESLEPTAAIDPSKARHSRSKSFGFAGFLQRRTPPPTGHTQPTDAAAAAAAVPAAGTATAPHQQHHHRSKSMGATLLAPLASIGSHAGSHSGVEGADTHGALHRSQSAKEGRSNSKRRNKKRRRKKAQEAQPAVWDLWFLADGARHHEEAPVASRPNQLHAAVRAAMQDAAALVAALSRLVSRWPHPSFDDIQRELYALQHPSLSGDCSANDQQPTAGTATAATAVSNGVHHPAAAHQSTGAGGAAATAAAGAGDRASGSGGGGGLEGHTTLTLAPSLRSPLHPTHAGSPPAPIPPSTSAADHTVAAAAAQGGKQAAPPALPARPLRCMRYHREALWRAAQARISEYWRSTLEAMREDDGAHPVRMLRAEKLRAQHHIAMCAHELMCALDDLTTLLARAYDPHAHLQRTHASTATNTTTNVNATTATTTPAAGATAQVGTAQSSAGPKPPPAAPSTATAPTQTAGSGGGGGSAPAKAAGTAPAGGAGSATTMPGAPSGSAPPPPPAPPPPARVSSVQWLWELCPLLCSRDFFKFQADMAPLVWAALTGKRDATPAAGASAPTTTAATTASTTTATTNGIASAQIAPQANAAPSVLTSAISHPNGNGAAAGGNGHAPHLPTPALPEATQLPIKQPLAPPAGSPAIKSGLAVVPAAAAQRGELLLFKFVRESRRVHAALKYLLVLALAMSVAVLLVGLLPAGTLSAPPTFFFITCAVVMRPQVETTLNQAVLRVLATGLAIMLGWALMSEPGPANDAVLVVAMVVLANGLLTSLIGTQFKLGVYVFCISWSSVTLCQFVGCCGHTGSSAYAWERFVHVVAGVLLPVCVNHTLAPWFLSHWALQRAGDSYEAADRLLVALFDQFVTHIKRERMDDGVGDDGGGDVAGFGDGVMRRLARADAGGGGGGLGVNGGLGVDVGLGGAEGDGGAGRDGKPGAASGHVPPVALMAAGAAGMAIGPVLTPPSPLGPLADPSPIVAATQPNVGSAPANAGVALTDPAVVVIDMAPEPPAPPQAPTPPPPSSAPPPSDSAVAAQPAAVAAAANGNGLAPQQQQQQHAAPATPPPPPPPSLAQVQAPLTEIAAVLARDATLWQRGLMSTPRAVHILMAACVLLADRLAALQVSLHSAMGLSGSSISSWSSSLVTPLEPEIRKVLVGLRQLVCMTRELLTCCGAPRAERHALAQRLSTQVDKVARLRFAAHNLHTKLRASMHLKALAVVAHGGGGHSYSHHVGPPHGLHLNLNTHPTHSQNHHYGHSVSAGELLAPPHPQHQQQDQQHQHHPQHHNQHDPRQGEQKLTTGDVEGSVARSGIMGHVVEQQRMPHSASWSGLEAVAQARGQTQQAHHHQQHRGPASNAGRASPLPPVVEAQPSVTASMELPPLAVVTSGVDAVAAPAPSTSPFVQHGQQQHQQQQPAAELPPAIPQHVNGSAVIKAQAVGGAPVHRPAAGGEAWAGAGAAVAGEWPPSAAHMTRGLSAVLPVHLYHPSDTVVWLACLYALTHAMDAAIHVARVAVAGLDSSAPALGDGGKAAGEAKH